MLADLKADLFVTQVGIDPNPLIFQEISTFPHVTGLPVGDVEERGLRRRKPGRELAGVVFDENRQEALKRAQNGAMQHDGSLTRVVLGHVLGIETLREHEVDLQRAALPVTADGIPQHELEFRAVEGALTRVQRVLQACGLDGRLQGTFGPVPGLVRACALFRPVGELDRHLGEAEVGVHRLQQAAERDRFGVDLVLGAENVGVVLGEGAHPHEPVQGTRGLVAVARAKLGNAQRQVAVALHALLVDQHVTWAVHRLHREHAVLGLSDEHVLAVVVPVAGLLPQGAIEQLRALHFDVARLREALAHVRFHVPPQRPARRMPEHTADRLLLLVEQAELAADAAVVTLLGFLETRQIVLQLLIVAPRGAVHPLQHFVLRVAAPVGTGHLHEFEGLELAGGRHVRATAQIEPFPLTVEADLLVGRDARDDLGLVVFAHALEQGDRLVTTHEAALHLVVGLGQLLHLCFELLEVLRRERTLVGKVVIEAVIDDRADGDLRRRVDRLHRLGQQVRRGVTNDLQGHRIFVRDDRQ